MLTVKTDVFDAGAVALAMITLSVFHPGALLPGPDKVEASIDEMEDQESAGVFQLQQNRYEIINKDAYA